MLDRDDYMCQHCKGRNGDPKLQYHHKIENIPWKVICMKDLGKMLHLFFQEEKISQVEQHEFKKVLEEKKKHIHKIIENDGVFKYVFYPSLVSFWIVLGKTRDYLILPPHYCSCMDFHYNAITRKLEICCYHVIAQIVAKISEKYMIIRKKDEVFTEYLNRVLIKESM